jgi:hypothetical protein
VDVTITSSQTGGFTAAIFLLLRRSRFVQCLAGFVGIRTIAARWREIAANSVEKLAPICLLRKHNGRIN